MKVTTIGIDIAKTVFQLHGIDEHGKVVLKKRLKRNEFLNFMSNLPECVVGMESCGGAHHWARQLNKQGHNVKLISPQFVKPYVKSNKNDAKDAEAICEAVTRPHMRFVSIKSIEHHDIQALHRVREQILKNRTMLVNQIRGLLAEYGIVMATGVNTVRKKLPLIVEDADNSLTPVSRTIFDDLYQELLNLDRRIDRLDKEISSISSDNELCRRLMTIPGVGPIVATAFIGSVVEPRCYRNGRALSAWIGLVPRQYSSGGKGNLLGISKRGDSYLRKQLINGARAVVSSCNKRNDYASCWARELKDRRGTNIASVAQANKMARVAWVIMTGRSLSSCLKVEVRFLCRYQYR